MYWSTFTYSVYMMRFLKSCSEKYTVRQFSFSDVLGNTWSDKVNSRIGFNLPCKSYAAHSFSTGTKVFGVNKKAFKGTDADTDHLSELDSSLQESLNGLDDISILQQDTIPENEIEMFKKISGGDMNTFENLKSLHQKIEVISSQFGVKLSLNEDKWYEMLTCKPARQRNFVSSLIINEIKDEKKKRKQRLANLYPIPDEDKSDEDGFGNLGAYDDVQCYHLFHNSLFLKLRDHAMKKVYYARGIAAMLHSSDLVFDCSYQCHMSFYEIKALARQLISSVSVNLKSKYPFHTVFCNVDRSDQLCQMLEKQNPIFFHQEYPVTITEESYLDLYPKNKIVYLTPHCKTPLKSVQPDKVYIIGGFVDKSCKRPISLAKAKEHDIAVARLPIDEYVNWKRGTKSLPLPHVTQILLDARANNNDWHKAFDIIPVRCVEEDRIPMSQRRPDFGAKIADMFDALEGPCETIKNG